MLKIAFPPFPAHVSDAFQKGMGFAKVWGQVLALRVVLGVFAAGYFPSCMYLLSAWYLRCKLASALNYPKIPLALTTFLSSQTKCRNGLPFSTVSDAWRRH